VLLTLSCCFGSVCCRALGVSAPAVVVPNSSCSCFPGSYLSLLVGSRDGHLTEQHASSSRIWAALLRLARLHGQTTFSTRNFLRTVSISCSFVREADGSGFRGGARGSRARAWSSNVGVLVVKTSLTCCLALPPSVFSTFPLTWRLRRRCERAAWVTPVPWGSRSVTRACLSQNTPGAAVNARAQVVAPDNVPGAGFLSSLA